MAMFGSEHTLQWQISMVTPALPARYPGQDRHRGICTNVGVGAAMRAGVQGHSRSFYVPVKGQECREHR